MSFLYEPYFISLIIALIFTLIMYVVYRNQKKKMEEEEGDEGKKRGMSPETRSILIFICSYSFFTGLLYILKNMFFKNTNIQIDMNTIEAVKETVMGGIEKVEEIVTENVDEIFKPKEEEESPVQKYVDENLVAGKKKKHKDRDSLKHMNSQKAKFADHDVDFKPNSFDL